MYVKGTLKSIQGLAFQASPVKQRNEILIVSASIIS